MAKYRVLPGAKRHFALHRDDAHLVSGATPPEGYEFEWDGVSTDAAGDIAVDGMMVDQRWVELVEPEKPAKVDLGDFGEAIDALTELLGKDVTLDQAMLLLSSDADTHSLVGGYVAGWLARSKKEATA